MVDDEHLTKIDELVAHFSEFRVRGEMKDSMGTTYPVDVKLDRFKEYRDIEKESGHSRPIDPATRTADSLTSVSRSIASISANLRGIKRAIEGREPEAGAQQTSWGQPTATPEPEDVPF